MEKQELNLLKKGTYVTLTYTYSNVKSKYHRIGVYIGV